MSSTLIHRGNDVLLEAPNWTQDGRLILNGDGVLWTLTPMSGASTRQVPITGVPVLNNDHVLAPNGTEIFISANDWQIYRASLSGGDATRITAPDDGILHFLHGVSPDGTQLAYTAVKISAEMTISSAHVHTIRVDGGDDRPLFQGGPSDGSEYSPDGEWVYFNTEHFSDTDGHAQIARIRSDGSGLEQLTFDDRVNWFPHLPARGELAVYLSFPPGTIGHPADLPVELRLVRNGNWRDPETIVTLFGGQGTINVNSWSPDGTQFAYVDYPIDDVAQTDS
nr:hypothetical protein [Agromyces luteolus]